MSDLKIAEQFYSVQGEGMFAGAPAIFLRLAGCNLSCGWDRDLDEYEQGHFPTGDAKWVCDTIDVWREADKTMTPDELIEDWRARGWMTMLERDQVHIVLTGGEPLLPAHQKAFSEFYELMDPDPFVEVETNGTQQVNGGMLNTVDRYNVSLKLSNSGHDRDERIDQEKIRQFVELGPGAAVFKFVIADEDDFSEAKSIMNEEGIPAEQVILMPAGQTRDQLEETYPKVAEIAKKHHMRFTPRLQVDTWGEVTGV